MVILGRPDSAQPFQRCSLTPILTALGVGGLAVALALQDTLSNLFGGFYVAVAGQVRLGDYVKLNTGEEGYATDIGWRRTTHPVCRRTIMIIVPNAKLAQAIVTNYSPAGEAAWRQIFVRDRGLRLRSRRWWSELLGGAWSAHAAGEGAGNAAGRSRAVAFEPGFGDVRYGGTRLTFHVTEFARQGPVRNGG